MLNNPVGWFEIYVQEMTRAKTFYETVFKTGSSRFTVGQKSRLYRRIKLFETLTR